MESETDWRAIWFSRRVSREKTSALGRERSSTAPARLTAPSLKQATALRDNHATSALPDDSSKDQPAAGDCRCAALAVAVRRLSIAETKPVTSRQR